VVNLKSGVGSGSVTWSVEVHAVTVEKRAKIKKPRKLPNKIFIRISFFDEDITACLIRWFIESLENQTFLKMKLKDTP
jgi:hypothetical protein